MSRSWGEVVGRAVGEAIGERVFRRTDGHDAASGSGPVVGERARNVFSRAAALTIDAVPVLFLVAVLQLAVVRPISGATTGLGLGVLWFPAWVLARVAYHAPLEGLLGWTPGKLALGLRVRGEDGRTPGIRAAFVRNAFRAVDGTFGNLVGVVVAGVREDGRRIGDWFSGTRVEAVRAPASRPADTHPVPDGVSDGHPGGRWTPADRPPDAQPERGPHTRPQGPEWGASALDAYARDLTAEAREGKLDPVVGREAEIRQVARTLGRTSKNNPVLVGEAGVGKTAIAEGLARMAAGPEGEAPAELRYKRVLELDLSAMESGTTLRGTFEERLRAVLEEATGEDVVLFVDEIHRLMAVGSSLDNPSPAAQMLKPALARGEVKMVGATTPGEYRRIEADPALERRFRPVVVPPLSVGDTAEVLRRGRWEASGEVRIEEEAISAAAPWAERYLKGNLPDAAISLMDDAVSSKKAEGGGTVGRDDLAAVIREQTGITVHASASERERLKGLEAELKKRVVGQDHAAGVVARTVRRRSTIGEDKPASLLFLGPTGVGKTEMAKALAEALFGEETRMVRIDMTELQDEGSVSRLIGSPRGYKESEQGGQLTERVRKEPYSVVLLDEIEKAHPRILAVLLQLLDEGRLTDGVGREVDFKHAIVVMTSNAGAERVLAGEADREAVVGELLSRGFLPELVGRIDERVVFGPLSEEALGEIVGLLAEKPLRRVEEDHGVRVSLDPSLVSQVVREGGGSRFGARELRGSVRDRVEDYLSERIMHGDFSGHRRAVLWYDEEAREVEWYDPEVEEPEATGVGGS